MQTANIRVSENQERTSLGLRDWIVEAIQRHVAKTDRPYSIALSGGSTPRQLYEMLGQLPVGTIDWQRVRLLWGDERNVPLDGSQSNYRMVREALLEHIDIPAENVWHVPDPGGDPAVAANAYAKRLSDLPLGPNQVPLIDLVLLGIGDDVHTASLFPHTKALDENDLLVCENWVEKLNCWRITMTYKLLNEADDVVFLICGASKQAALKAIWHGPQDAQAFPAQAIHPNQGRFWFMVDEDAIGETSLPAQAYTQRV